ncbi:ABC transporter ATP-binding protein [Cognatishimia activa]|uniref:Maltose/maltodextrin import ATP-binding protein MalK n=1 Tax=Cognatishimia activa TaxID=1715691 RepID=A0A0P1IMC9_9RHOB|nr:ABC transporter ATP-binding protein [Cognatishimia activa]MEE2944742.1 ABC transporter ATP-binding protein [Pseudomonadota bacterium]CUI32914.1 Maltose/maltodextrin import ATP-binding protein MalK [Cognatishimia activa]CUK24796.1 Maltose/maltodextrin import ATP-binding protein MalK [Cognatishimia activa]
MAEVRMTNVKKNYGSVEVIPDLSLTIPDGSFSVLVGPSGCGKSTLLRMIAGLEEVTDGSIHIDGEDVTNAKPSDRGIAMVFQSYALYPHMTVRQNIGFGLKLAKTPKDEIDRRVDEAADILQLGPLLDRKPRQLSGGQRQRVAIGRSIVRKPKVFLFDEPLSNLDAALRTQMRVELAELHAKLGATMVYVTHDQVEAMTMADQIVIMKAGIIQQVGRPMDLYNAPENPFVAGFIGSPKMNLIEGSIASARKSKLVGVRPEHIDVSPDAGEWEGTLRYAEHLGSDTVAYIDSEVAGSVTVRLQGEVAINRGDKVFMTPRAGNIHLFRENGAVERA